ncbi:MAG TPA: IS3 family transposase [Ktedonobacteraceae bacterium]
MALVDWTREELPVATQAELLSINRSSLYYQPVPPSAEEVALKHRIDEIYTQWPHYGSRRITAQLQREGVDVNRKAVMRPMHEMGIVAIYPGPNLSTRARQATIYPYLLKNVQASYPNHVWGLDITSIRLKHGWMYLVAILDWYSRYVLSWELDQTMQIAFVLEAMQRALSQARPIICNSDQGSQFTSLPYLNLLKKHEVQRSQDGRGRALDNVFTERLWRSSKYEDVYIKDYATPRELRQGLTEYLRFYNERRLHQSLNYRPPAELYYEEHQKEQQKSDIERG